MMENEFRIRKKIIGRTESTGEKKSERFIRDADLRGCYGEELVGVDSNTKSADRASENTFGQIGYLDNQTGTGGLYESTDSSADQESTADRRNAERISDCADKTSGDDSDSDLGFDETITITGWENERRILKAALFGETVSEQAIPEAYTFFSSADSVLDNPGVDTAYLAAELTGIVDEDKPVEDSTTTQKPHHERKNTLGSMGGM